MILALIDIPQPESFWPVTVVGWLTIATVLITLGVQLVGMGKFLEKLNGFGSRLTVNEQTAARLEGAQSQTALSMQALTIADTQMVERFSRSDTRIERCLAEAAEDRKMLLLRFDQLLEKKNTDHAAIKERIARLEERVEVHHQEANPNE